MYRLRRGVTESWGTESWQEDLCSGCLQASHRPCGGRASWFSMPSWKNFHVVAVPLMILSPMILSSFPWLFKELTPSASAGE